MAQKTLTEAAQKGTYMRLGSDPRAALKKVRHCPTFQAGLDCVCAYNRLQGCNMRSQRLHICSSKMTHTPLMMRTRKNPLTHRVIFSGSTASSMARAALSPCKPSCIRSTMHSWAPAAPAAWATSPRAPKPSECLEKLQQSAPDSWTNLAPQMRMYCGVATMPAWSALIHCVALLPPALDRYDEWLQSVGELPSFTLPIDDSQYYDKVSKALDYFIFCKRRLGHGHML